MVSNNPLERILDALRPGGHFTPVTLAILAGAGLVVLLVFLFLIRLLTRGGGGRGPAQEQNVRVEDVSKLPAAPTGAARLAIEGVPGRLRLVVIAPVGKTAALETADVPDVLDQFLRGLGAVVERDKPRIVVWPAQLSNQGFGVVFHRNVRRPEADGQPSRWILAAGPTPARPRPWLLGLAVQADSPCSIGRLTLRPEQWIEVMRVLS